MSEAQESPASLPLKLVMRERGATYLQVFQTDGSLFIRTLLFPHDNSRYPNHCNIRRDILYHK